MISVLVRATGAFALCCAAAALAPVALAADQHDSAHAAQAAPLAVDGAWVRATVPGQGGTGAFMTLRAAQALTLVGAETPAAGVAEVHEMRMDGNTMHMRSMADGLALPAGQPVTLTPGGQHVMLMDLKQPLAAGSQIRLTLTLRDAKGALLKHTLELPVRLNAPGGGAPAPASHGHGHGS